MSDQDRTVRDDPHRHRYEIVVDGEPVGYAAYRDDARRRVFTHTRIDPEHEGQGVGSALARAALDDTRSHGLEVIPRCPFIAEFIDRHPEYADLVADPERT